MSNAGDLASTIGRLVPSIYYDLIARVVPGVALISAYTWIPGDGVAAKLSPFSPVVLFLGAGYIAGLVLTPVAAVISQVVAYCLRTKLELPYDSNALGMSAAIADRNDQVAAQSAEAGATLAKMQAESTLCCNLFVAFLLLVVVSAAGERPIPVIQQLTCSGGILLGVLLLLAACFREIAYLFRQDTLHKQYVREES